VSFLTLLAVFICGEIATQQSRTLNPVYTEGFSSFQGSLNHSSRIPKLPKGLGSVVFQQQNQTALLSPITTD
jgi:hypothetical protein